MSRDDLIEAYVRLKALHNNMPDRVIAQRSVDDFHEILGLLERHSSVDLGRFKVPTNAIITRDPEIFYDLHFVKSKVEALLSFFELRSSEPKSEVGFRPQ